MYKADEHDLMWATEVKQALERAIERQITRRAWGRIKELEVEVKDSLIFVRGFVPSFFFKQLALEGVLDLIDPAGPMRIETNDLVVEGPSQCGASGPGPLARIMHHPMLQRVRIFAP
jgi:hypothetical protein